MEKSQDLKVIRQVWHEEIEESRKVSNKYKSSMGGEASTEAPPANINIGPKLRGEITGSPPPEDL